MSRGHHLLPKGLQKRLWLKEIKVGLVLWYPLNGYPRYPSNLDQCPGSKNKKLVMEKVLLNPTFQFSLFNSFIPKGLAIAT